MSGDFPSATLLRVILRKARDDPERFERALTTGNLTGYLANYIWLESFDAQLVDLYQRSPSAFYAKFIIDSIADEGSEILDTYVFEPYHYSKADPANLTPSTLKSFQSISKVVHPLKKVKVGCFAGFLCCAGFSIFALSRGRMGSTFALTVGSVDLMRISYNCYDKRYEELYLNKLGGSVNRVCDTVFNVTKSLLGLCPNPLVQLCTQIEGGVLIRDTTALGLLKQVSTQPHSHSK